MSQSWPWKTRHRSFINLRLRPKGAFRFERLTLKLGWFGFSECFWAKLSLRYYWCEEECVHDILVVLKLASHCMNCSLAVISSVTWQLWTIVVVARLSNEFIIVMGVSATGFVLLMPKSSCHHITGVLDNIAGFCLRQYCMGISGMHGRYKLGESFSRHTHSLRATRDFCTIVLLSVSRS